MDEKPRASAQSRRDRIEPDGCCSVVVPCHNGAELTRACIASLLQQTGVGVLEILLVDNGSTDATADLAQLDARVRVLSLPTNRGFAGGVNAGIAAARGDYVLVLNNDTQAARNLLRELMAALTSDSRIGAAGAVSNHVKGEALVPVGDLGREHHAREEIAQALQPVTQVQDVDSLAGLCLLLRRATLLAVGPFDERFGHGNYEDDDYSLRLRQRGYRLVIARRAFLHHEGHATFRALGLDVRTEIGQRRLQFAAKWAGDASGRAVMAALRGRLSAAAAAAQEAQRHRPQWLDADWFIGRAYAAAEPTRAIRHLESFLLHCPEHVDARLALGLALLRSGAARRGQALLTDTVERHQLLPTQQRELVQQLGEIDYYGRSFAAAESHFHHALELSPQSGELHNWIGLCRLARGEHRRAIAAFSAAIEHGFELAHTNVGICHYALGDRETAQRHLAAATVELPDNPIARANYAALTGGATNHATADPGEPAAIAHS